MSVLLAYIISVFIYALFILLVAMNAGSRWTEVSFKYLFVRIGGLVCGVYLIQYFQEKYTFVGNLITSVGYLFVFFIIGSYFGETFFQWFAGVRNDKK